MALLNIVIGLIFVMLLFSLLATTVLELVQSFMSLRGKQLNKALRSMLQDQTGSFFQHPYFQQLKNGSQNGLTTKYTRGVEPSYINPETFSAIVMDMLTKNNQGIANNVASLKDGTLKEMMEFIMRKAGDDPDKVSKAVEKWFNDVMDRLAGAYKRILQYLNFLIGLVIAVLFNVDPFTIYYNLSINTAFRDVVADAATSFVQNEANRVAAPAGTFDQARTQLTTLVNDNIKVLESPLGIGWSQVNWELIDPTWWTYHVIGWLVTALCITLGSPFWFDLLKSLVNMRGAGTPPANTTIVVPPAGQPAYPPASDAHYYPPATSGSPYDIPAQPAGNPPHTPPASIPSPPPVFLPPTDIPNDVANFDDLSARLDNS